MTAPIVDAQTIRTQDDAVRAIATLAQHQSDLVSQGRDMDAKFQKLDQKVQTVLDAQRALTTRAAVADLEPVGTDRDLGAFVREDKSIRWRSGVEAVDVPGLGRVEVRSPGLLDTAQPASEWHADLLRIVSARNMARAAMPSKAPKTPTLDADLAAHLWRAPRPIRDSVRRAFDGQTGQGAEWLDDQFIPDLYVAFQTPRALRGAFGVVNVTTDTVIRPKLTRGARPYLKGQIRSDDPAHYTPSTPRTAQSTIQIQGMAVRILVDDATLEDSAVVAGAAMRGELVAALDDGWEDCTINGDTASSHQDAIASWDLRSRWGAAGLGGDADHRRGWLGGRAAAVDKGTTLDLSGTMSIANFAALMALFGERGAGSLIAVTSPEALVQDFLTMSDVVTLDKFGANATAIAGVGGLAALLGVPLILSRFMGADLNASGVYDGVTTTKTGVLMYDRTAWSRYNRRASTVETDKEIASGTVEMVATVRETFDTPDDAAALNVAYGYNL